MRSAREIRFRLAQQAANVGLVARTPSLPRGAKVAALPLPPGAVAAERLRDTSFARELERLADEVVAHRFPLLGISIETGPDIEWRRDYVNGRCSEASYFRFVPYLDFERVGDHKNVWELNRHQHLVLLAQAFLLTGREKYLLEIASQLESWFEQNPFLRGINWASALEVAFRALSWLWIDHLVGERLSATGRQQLRNGLYQHAFYLEHNLSTYFSPNTHLLGEGVALHALGLKFSCERWRSGGGAVVREELQRQVQADGSHFEQSTYYHAYALDFFLLHYLLAGRPAPYEPVLRKMAHFLAAVNGPSGELSFFGDDDGGRLFHPYGPRSEFGRATLATCAALFPDDGLLEDDREMPVQACWWLPNAEKRPQPAAVRLEKAAELFPDVGLAAITRGDLQVLVDAGRFGPGGAGHSHSDTLSLTIRRGSEEILVDPGTYTYMADPRQRDAFRGTAYHNTIRVDQLDQADPVRPFRWENKPSVRVRQWTASLDTGDPDRECSYLDAECSYRGILHRRRFLLIGDSIVLILDELSGGGGEHLIEQFWHAGAPVCVVPGSRARIGSATALFAAPATPEIESGWRSRALGEKSPAPVIALRWRAAFPQLCAAAFVLTGDGSVAHLALTQEGGDVVLRLGEALVAQFPGTGEPAISRS